MQATFPDAACSSVDKSHLRAASSVAIRLLRDVARKPSYRTGALSPYHWLRNRQVLTPQNIPAQVNNPAANSHFARYLTLGLAILVVVQGFLIWNAHASDDPDDHTRPVFGVGRLFSADSPWNTPIDPSRVTYTAPSTIENRQFRDTALANTWIQEEDLLFKTPADAPVRKWDYETFNNGDKDVNAGRFSHSGTLNLATPESKITHGGDGWLIFTDLDGVHFWETWGAHYDAKTKTYHVAYIVKGNLKNGTGWGKDGAGVGIRAAGASLLGGLILPEELNNLSIEHALSMDLDWSQLKEGKESTDQYVFPAVAPDSDSLTAYKGTIPMGARFAIPHDVDLSAAGLTPEGLAVAKAFQKYGGYVTDAAGHTASVAVITGGTKQQIANLYTDANWIRQHLVMVVPK
jgi:hypothetical protein